MIEYDNLPEKICLEDYGGNYRVYIDAIYAVFERDFIRHKSTFGTHKLSLKYHPEFQERAYTFYHMTHKGDIESEREPDLRRCECLPWARPTIENVEDWNLKFWRQYRQRSGNRVCIALETEEETYFVILEVRETYVLLWTAFLSEYRHQSKKKLKEYEEWKKGEGVDINTPDELIASIQNSIKKARG
ncbi:MAG: hypothetical protein LUD17_13615 [Bacteroidales bacterium]|nr:hypothetical protein [Bacteroidales bacterium]